MSAIRWVENGKVIERAIKILPNLKSYIDGVKAKPPQTKNFGIVKKYLADEFLNAKLVLTHRNIRFGTIFDNFPVKQTVAAIIVWRYIIINEKYLL